MEKVVYALWRKAGESREAFAKRLVNETGPQLLPDMKTQLARWARIVKAAGFSSEDRGSTK